MPRSKICPVCGSHISPGSLHDVLGGKEPGFPPDNHARIRIFAVAGIAAQIMSASVTKRRGLDGRDDVSFMPPKEAAECAAEIWIESAEAVRNMDGA